jgi:hypothetical protein
MRKIAPRTLLGALLWSELFIAIPAWLGSMVYRALIMNSHYQALCIKFGFWGVVLGMTLPMLACVLAGMFIGYCCGLIIGCRLFGKAQFSSWVLGDKETWFLSKLTKRVLNIISN